MSVNIKDVNAEIQRLTAVRNDYFKKQTEELRKKFLQLDWVNGLDFTFDEGSGPYGHREYVLRGVMPAEFMDLFHSQLTIQVTGNSKNYMDNIVARRPYNIESMNIVEFYTCNADTFKDFINKGMRISLPSDFKKRLSVYEALHELNK